ncbi:hypothetical protein Pcinc_043064 [Petrolisthes cinctipes]|uniref:Solute carrier organic anion transporter family member n=2 Tax=Petrolisthes cinctipes TaxID=88211 RepID=A0AAE1BGI5_PETCI|nr:hypothetical protein Pcinc_043064 [Petrolisthes cinctipes]
MGTTTPTTPTAAAMVLVSVSMVGQCGWLCLRPRILQHTRTAKWVLFWLCWAAAAQGMVVNGFVNVCITTIEKKYNLRSTDTGLIAGAYDMASVLCCVPVSYLGSRVGSSKPRWLGWGIFIMGVGSFVFTLPHFISPAYNPSSTTTTSGGIGSVLLCLKEGTTRESQCTVLVENWLSSFRHIFVMGQFLHGVGASPLYTLGVTYLDESVEVKMSSMYLGIFYAMAVVGPAAGYVLGGQFLKVYIDSPNIHPDTFGVEPVSDLWLGAWFGVEPVSDLWLGAWWIGFLLSGTISVLISWPIMAFPALLPGAKAIKATRVSEAHNSGQTLQHSHTSSSSSSRGIGGGGGGFGRLRDLPQAVRVLAVNPTFLALSLAGATEGILLAGFATFTPKFLENQFSMPASLAALIVGFVAVPAGGGGTMIGGWIIKRLQLTCSGILKMCIIFSMVCLLACFTFVISCPNTPFAGVNVDFVNRSTSTALPNLTSLCNGDCECNNLPYDPVCGSNNVMYFSPCHAGCGGMVRAPDGVKVFTGCKCMSPHSPLLAVGAEAGDPRLAPDSALREKCPSTCSLMPIFLAIFFVVMMLTFIISLPALSGTLRCVPDSHRSFALGLQWIVIRLLGTIPGPILFGSLFDNTCTLWQNTCGRGGACRSYDNFYMSRYMMGTSILFKFLSTILFFLAWWLYVAPPSPPPPDPPPNTATGPPTTISDTPAPPQYPPQPPPQIV